MPEKWKMSQRFRLVDLDKDRIPNISQVTKLHFKFFIHVQSKVSWEMENHKVAPDSLFVSEVQVFSMHTVRHRSATLAWWSQKWSGGGSAKRLTGDHVRRGSKLGWKGVGNGRGLVRGVEWGGGGSGGSLTGEEVGGGWGLGQEGLGVDHAKRCALSALIIFTIEWKRGACNSLVL